MAQPREVCDDCLMVAYDEGVDDGEAQITLMVTTGSELPDHECILSDDEPDDGWVCDCTCRSDDGRGGVGV